MNVEKDIQVPKSYCDWITEPANFSTCHIACPGDCVLSEWSDWSSCSKVSTYFHYSYFHSLKLDATNKWNSSPKECAKGEQQQRTRSLLRNKSPEGAKCPHSIETRDCVLNETCFTYKWAFTPFSSCLPLGGSHCGEGITTKAVYCQRSDSRAVDDR